MSTYMYTSATGTNWDDDEDDFDPSVYVGAVAEFGAADLAELSLANTRAALNESQSAIEDEQVQECTYFSLAASVQQQVDYNIDPDYYPTYAGRMTQSWYSDDYRRPAYAALSHEGGYAYPYERRKYSTNWKAAKLSMGANMKNTMLMAPSPLRLTKTWTSDSIGEYVEERGYEYLALPSPRVPTPRLMHGSESEEEREEVLTPPDTPLMAKVSKYELDVNQYDPITGAIDLPAHNIEAMEVEMAREFAAFSGVVAGLDIDQILGDVEENALHTNFSEAAARVTGSAIKAQPTAAAAASNTEAILATSPLTVEATKPATAASALHSDSKEDASTAPAESNVLGKTSAAVRCPSPDLKYFQAPTNNSLVWNTVASGFFALSSLPWSHIAVVTAGAMVDLAAFVSRR